MIGILKFLDEGFDMAANPTHQGMVDDLVESEETLVIINEEAKEKLVEQ